MNAVPPQPPPSASPITPSNSVVLGAAIGAPAAVLISWILDANGIKVPPEAEAAMGTIFGTIAAYFGNGGKAAHLFR